MFEIGSYYICSSGWLEFETLPLSFSNAGITCLATVLGLRNILKIIVIKKVLFIYFYTYLLMCAHTCASAEVREGGRGQALVVSLFLHCVRSAD